MWELITHQIARFAVQRVAVLEEDTPYFIKTLLCGPRRDIFVLVEVKPSLVLKGKGNTFKAFSELSAARQLLSQLLEAEDIQRLLSSALAPCRGKGTGLCSRVTFAACTCGTGLKAGMETTLQSAGCFFGKCINLKTLSEVPSSKGALVCVVVCLFQFFCHKLLERAVGLLLLSQEQEGGDT